MGMPIIPKLINRKRSQWFKMLFFIFLGICLFFAPMYGWFFGKFLSWSIFGIMNIPAKILAILMWIFAYDAKQIG